DKHARRRSPRPDPRAGSTGEQSQGRQRRDPQAPADGVHRGVGLGEELTGLRHHRGGVATDDQRDLQRLRAGLHAVAGAPRGRLPRGADHRDHRRPGADGGQPPVHGRHGDRRQRDAAHPLQPTGVAADRSAHRVLVQRPDPQGERSHVDRQGRPGGEERGPRRRLPRRHVSSLRGHGHHQRHRPHRAVRRLAVPRRRGAEGPGLLDGRLVRPPVRGDGTADGQADRDVHHEAARRDAPRGAD
ncbi:MAG: Excinuclease ABC subunit A paralog of unknown function, partial [uncultured Nocardioides sp.]